MAGPGAPSMRDAFAWLARAGLRGVQLDATSPETRARDLSASARRDLRATMHRNELICAGLDFLIPPAHYADPTHVSRAFDAIVGAIGLAADLGRVPVTAPLPSDVPADIRDAVAAEGTRLGVSLLLSADSDAFAAAAPQAWTAPRYLPPVADPRRSSSGSAQSLAACGWSISSGAGCAGRSCRRTNPGSTRAPCGSRWNSRASRSCP